MKRVALAAALALLVLVQLPDAWSEARSAWDLVKLWGQPAEQYRRILGDVPYDGLVQAERLLPRDAVVLLATQGTDVRHREYTTFHRALYFLAPRPVHWISPAPDDGTWEARWWRTSPVTPEAQCAVAAEVGATHILTLDAAPELACAAKGGPASNLGVLSLVALDGAAEPAPVAAPWAGLGPIGVLPALAVPLVIGWALVGAALRRRPVLHDGVRLAGAWVIGGSIVTLFEVVDGALGAPPVERMVLLGVAALAFAYTFVSWRRGTPLVRRGLSPVVRSPVTLAIGAVLVVELALVAVLAIGRPRIAWDGWAHWGMKARALFEEGRVTMTFLEDLTRASTLSDSPLHVPTLEAWLYGWLGYADERLAGVLALATFAALLALCFGALRSWGAGLVTALGLTAVLGSITWLWRVGAASFADVPLALVLAVACVILVRWLETGARGTLVIGAIAAGLLPWVKSDGVMWLAVVVVVLFSFGLVHADAVLRGRALRAAVFSLLAGMVLSGPWWILVLTSGIGGDNYDLSLSALIANLDRLGTIVSMQLGMLAWPVWLPIWLGAAGLAAALAVRQLRRVRSSGLRLARPRPGPDTFLLAVSGLGLAALTVPYLLTTFVPYTEQIESSGYRLALQALPITFLWLARRLLPVLAAAPPGAQPALAADPPPAS